MTTQHSTTQQVNILIEFRQATYQHAFSQERDAQFELLDALTSSGAIYAFPEKQDGHPNLMSQSAHLLFFKVSQPALSKKEPV